VRLESGPNPGNYFYTRDHLGSIRELTDIKGNVRARYTYDPYGRRTKLAGDVDVDFGFTGLFWANEASLYLARFRAYDPELGRWLSRDPLRNAEQREGPNLYAYVSNNPVNNIDPLGLQVSIPELNINPPCCANTQAQLDSLRSRCLFFQGQALEVCGDALVGTPEFAVKTCAKYQKMANDLCHNTAATDELESAANAHLSCMLKSGCRPPVCPGSSPPSGLLGPVGSAGAAMAEVIKSITGATSGGGWSGPSYPPDIANGLDIIFH